jgi:hypothetical protein
MSQNTIPPLQRMQGWAFPQSVGEPERWELTSISGSGLPVSNDWPLSANSFISWKENSLSMTTI